LQKLFIFLAERPGVKSFWCQGFRLTGEKDVYNPAKILLQYVNIWTDNQAVAGEEI